MPGAQCCGPLVHALPVARVPWSFSQGQAGLVQPGGLCSPCEAALPLVRWSRELCLLFEQDVSGCLAYIPKIRGLCSICMCFAILPDLRVAHEELIAGTLSRPVC